MKNILFAVMAALIVISCQNEVELLEDSNVTNEMLSRNDYSISVDEALANLEEFLVDAEDSATRTSKSRIVNSIKPIKYNAITTRTDVDCENLLYVANFEGEQGYAILAGDTRIGDEILAVADEGCLSDATIYTAIELANEERIIIDGYPTTGPGFFTTPETGDELFINPNTVSLYDETVNDTFVGNFSLDDIDAEDEYLTRGINNTEIPSTPELITSSLCVSYATNEINEYDHQEHLLLKQDDEASGGGGGSSSMSRTETEISAWSVKESVSPLLTKYVKWGQRSPFNDLYPKRRKYLLFGKSREAPAGCFPLSIAKILTHFEYPTIFTHNDYTVNWIELKKSFESSVGKLSAAHLLRGISSACDSWYFYAGTFTFPHKVTSFMRSIGLRNSHSHSYSFDRVTEMIDKGCPLIIYSVPGVNILKSHSWNIDGYKIKERTITTKKYSGNTLQKTTTETETYKMVHCDFGWKGKCNGYYVSGVFKLNDSNIEHDPSTNYSGNTNYNNLLKVITYDKP